MEAGRVHEFASVIWLMRRLPGEALALSRSFKALFRRWCRALPRTEMQYTSSRRCSTRVRVSIRQHTSADVVHEFASAVWCRPYG